jgi:hypothetical protein
VTREPGRRPDPLVACGFALTNAASPALCHPSPTRGAPRLLTPAAVVPVPGAARLRRSQLRNQGRRFHAHDMPARGDVQATEPPVARDSVLPVDRGCDHVGHTPSTLHAPDPLPPERRRPPPDSRRWLGGACLWAPAALSAFTDGSACTPGRSVSVRASVRRCAAGGWRSWLLRRTRGPNLLVSSARMEVTLADRTQVTLLGARWGLSSLPLTSPSLPPYSLASWAACPPT